MNSSPLPVDDVLSEVQDQLLAHGTCLLVAPPGSGKTTRVPASLLRRCLDGEVGEVGEVGEIVVLQPRRLAARALARRVAWEWGTPLGQEVGYQVRHDRCLSARTRIRFVTEGVLVRQLLADPSIPRVDTVILDEFHERHLEGDLALAMLAEVRETIRPDLRLLIMSATLDPGPLRRYLDPCPLVQTSGRLFEVDLRYESDSSGPLPRRVARAVQQALREATRDGDVLVFLPGQREIRDCELELESLAAREDLLVLPLHGRLGPEQQDLAILPNARRKVVLATNVAESSLTIEGVVAVVDSGLVRLLRHDVGRGLDRLVLERVSLASAEQRRGRAGRVRPGRCYRLWSKAEERGMQAFQTAEIHRADLAGVVLQALAFAGRAPRDFGWFEAPEASALHRAETLLERLGATTGAGDRIRITPVGREMLHHPLHPRLARMLVEGRRCGCEREAAELAALLAERDIRTGRKVTDILELREMLRAADEAGLDPAACRRQGIEARAAAAVLRARDQMCPSGSGRRGSTELEEGVIRSLLAGFPDRVSKRSSPTGREGTMATGQGFRLEMEDHEQLGELFLALQVREGGGRRRRQQARALVSLACPLREELLEQVCPDSFRSEESVALDAERGAVVARRRRLFLDLLLRETSAGRPDPEAAAALLTELLARDPWAHLGEQKELRQLFARLGWLRQQAPELELPELGDADLVRAAVSLCSGSWRLAELRRASLLPVLMQSLSPDQRRLLEREAPARIRLPSGLKARVDYIAEGGPLVAARLQEFFGRSQTPRLAFGRVPLLLQLLAPNQRPVQITRDLQSFWQNIYPKVRSELRRRYPKHDWPEDPTTAVPRAHPRRRPRT